MSDIWEAVYADAAKFTGKSEACLRVIAHQVFATMLHHMMQEQEQVIWSAAKMEKSGRFSVEVNITPRFRSGRPIERPFPVPNQSPTENPPPK